MVGRVWPRHSHRGRPLNAIVRTQLVSTVRALSLGMGLLSLVAAVFASFGIWLEFEMGLRNPPEQPPIQLAKSVASASCESLQRVCPILATSVDVLNEANRADFRRFNKLFHFALFGTLGWGVLSGACFLYIYARARQRESQ